MQIRRLRHDAHGGGAGVGEVPQDLVVGGGYTGPASGPEGDKRGVPEVQLGARPEEELFVLRVGTWPAAFDEGDPEVVELLGDPELVVDRERHALLLGAVPQRRVVDLHRLGQSGYMNVGMRCPVT